MGLCNRVEVEPEELVRLDLIKRNRAATRALEQSVKVVDSQTHLLLLGAGESGKSTIFKQMKVLNQGGYSTEELKAFRPIIHRNVVDALQILLHECEARDLTGRRSNEELADRFLLMQSDNLNPEIAQHVSRLWRDAAVQACYQVRDEFQLPSSAKIFLDDAERIGANDYVPMVADVVRTSCPAPLPPPSCA